MAAPLRVAINYMTRGLMTIILVGTLVPAELVAAPASVTQVVTRLDEVFAKRDDRSIAGEIERAISEAERDYARDYEVLWRLARLRWWQADGAATGPEKEAKAKAAYGYAVSAIQVEPNGAEGHLYAGVAVAAEGEAVGPLTAAWRGIVATFNRHIDRAIELDDGLELGAPLVAKGRYFYRLPWIKGRDLSRSRAILQKCVDRFPTNLRAKLYLAETLAAEGRTRQAKKLLEQITTASVGYSPPEGRRIQAWARLAREEIE